MRTVELEEARMTALCLSWIASRDEDEHPVVLYSGGPLLATSRYHILAARPSLLVLGRNARDDSGAEGRIRVLDAGGKVVAEESFSALLPLLRRTTASKARVDPVTDVPFAGGWLGYFGYDLAWLFEYGIPRFLRPDSELPDLWLAWFDSAIVMDRAGSAVHGDEAALAELLALSEPSEPAPIEVLKDQRAFHREEYEAAVDRVRDHCLRGDLFQADMSRRIALGVSGSAIDLFQQLVRKSPAPFAAYLGLGDGQAVVSSSPEEFLQVRGSNLRTQPIKGTRPRGGDAADDSRLRDELVASEKDVAELTMIVDLMRNDLGRVARPGTVRVREFPAVMELPQVFHLYAVIEAELLDGRDVWDVIAACFPPGSISGAPKPMAIEILELVERTRRGVYTGSIGYIGVDGNAHLNVAIRTAEWSRGRLRFGVGGGITVGSDPAAEFEETLDKARGLALALGITEL